MGARDEIARLRRHQQVLMELAHLAAHRLPGDGLLETAVAQVARGTEIDHVKLLRYRPETGDLLIEAGVGWKEGVVGRATFGADLSSPPGHAFQTGQPVHILDLRRSDQYRMSATLREHGIVSVLNVPVQIDGSTWGVLEVDSSVERDFSGDTRNFLMIAASIVASAIHREQVGLQHEQAIAELALESRRHQLLLHEMQHRTKNNFQIVLSMIAIQAARLQTENSRNVLGKIDDGIMAMALAHDQLAPAQGGELVNLPTYLRALIASIQKPLETVAVDVRADELNAPIEYAVPIGLIVNELVTNSVKHGFDEAGGAIQVELVSGAGRGELSLEVTDNGKGIDPAKPGGSGLKLIEALARQVRGRIEQESSSAGTRTRLAFTLP
ncbi:MAG TPA: histidine kinase dimerization/phosphoacceptor domain -containing protein [Geminicoccus sp.]|uniref:sensor histidine kinase n=1 Tax=Geminicoccus sp. TaxID=2024832 RepID=UPI002B8ACDDC|nr:histidine kinase dimerization/phosphoacceptor domain -containing protein [Geminicoccus sp.]HWL70608.1 histidine kinase dimerization/phosphoacceptor domain -containing protein [Geminicoccus sp.]